MDSASKKIIILVGAIILVLVGIYVWSPKDDSNDNKPSVALDKFAQCLKDKGAVFYGASWCSHCQNQKKMFGEAGKFLPYVECSTTPGRGGDQTQECKDKKITGYPTWMFTNGLTMKSSSAPRKCTDAASESATCKNYYNPDYGVWVFSDGTIVGSGTDPVQKDETWTFGPNSRITGEIPLEKLAENTGCELPKEN